MPAKPAAQSFRDLQVWQRSIDLTTAIYRLSQTFPREELYGLTGQMRRAALSIPGNIAEGQGRLAVKEFRHFLGIARGSNFERQTQLEVARRLKLGESKEIDSAEALSHKIGKILYALLLSLKSTHELTDNRQPTTDNSLEPL